MLMFNDGDRIVTKDGYRGKFIEEYAGVAYLELDNGVELDCPILDIMLEADYKTPEEIKREKSLLSQKENDAVAECILPNVEPLILALAEFQARGAALAVSVLGGSAKSWDDLTAFQKMNFVCIASGVKFSEWVDAYNNDKMTTFLRNNH